MNEISVHGKMLTLFDSPISDHIVGVHAVGKRERERERERETRRVTAHYDNAESGTLAVAQ